MAPSKQGAGLPWPLAQARGVGLAFLASLCEPGKACPDRARRGASLEIAHRLIELRSNYHQMAHEKNWPAASLVLIDALFERPVLTIKRVRALAQVTTPTASAHLKRLEEAGIVSEQTGRPRNRIYLAPELVRAVHTHHAGA